MNVYVCLNIIWKKDDIATNVTCLTYSPEYEASNPMLGIRNENHEQQYQTLIKNNVSPLGISLLPVSHPESLVRTILLSWTQNLPERSKPKRKSEQKIEKKTTTSQKSENFDMMQEKEKQYPKSFSVLRFAEIYDARASLTVSEETVWYTSPRNNRPPTGSFSYSQRRSPCSFKLFSIPQ